LDSSEEIRNQDIYKEILSEWRGLLALLALAKYLNLPVSVEKVQITSSVGNQIFTNFPQENISGTSWENIGVILYDNKPIGMLSPLTLVCTSPNYSNIIDSRKVPWYNGAKLQDPIYKLGNKEKALLKMYLTNISNLIKINSGSEIDNKINGLIQDFINQIGEVEKINEEIIEPQQLSDKFYDVFKAVITSYSIIPPRTSDIGIKKNGKLYILYDENMKEQFKNGKVKIYGDYTLDQVSNVREIIKESEDIELIDVEKLFTQKIIKLDPDEIQLPGTYNKNNFIIPLKEDIFKVFTPDKIRDNLEIKEEGKEVIVRFTINFEKSGLTFTKEKRYKENDVVLYDKFLIIAFWPFVAPDYPGYLFISKYIKEDSHISVEPATFISEENKGGIKNEFDVFEVNEPPTYIKIKYKNDYAGFILVEQPETPQSQEKKEWIVSIDFGTDNTIAFYRKGKKEEIIEKITPQDLTKIISSPKDENLLNSHLFNYFVPKSDIPLPLVTAYRVFDRIDENPLLHGNIVVDVRELDIFGNVKLNLKWSEEPEDRYLIRAWINQFAFHIVSQAVKNGVKEIKFKFAYPTALKNEGDYKSHFSGAIESLKKKVENFIRIDDNIEWETESVASAKFYGLRAFTVFYPLISVAELLIFPFGKRIN
jgi:hypothetical protein